MDPDEALKSAREAVKQWNDDAPLGEDGCDRVSAQQLVDAFVALDGWLTMQGTMDDGIDQLGCQHCGKVRILTRALENIRDTPRTERDLDDARFFAERALKEAGITQEGTMGNRDGIQHDGSDRDASYRPQPAVRWRVEFTSGESEESPWTVKVDGVTVIEELNVDELEINSASLKRLWRYLGLSMTFDGAPPTSSRPPTPQPADLTRAALARALEGTADPNVSVHTRTRNLVAAFETHTVALIKEHS